ncbi:hypothetical protein AGOR_G00068780 [Albula goreensis]|uniref:Uncharacterized protein n=1 Tax=Albula goreensis TaxID=1534307 RepID=A0A8T3DNG3_9TELE|nr:hypothetical protein AGOR_G00068780 [Albula goreensis]
MIFAKECKNRGLKETCLDLNITCTDFLYKRQILPCVPFETGKILRVRVDNTWGSVVWEVEETYGSTRINQNCNKQPFPDVVFEVRKAGMKTCGK